MEATTKKRVTRAAYMADDTKQELIAKLTDAHQRTKDSDGGEFYASLSNYFRQWGSLTEKQEVAFLDALERDQVASEHVGKIGERREFRLTLVRYWIGTAHYNGGEYLGYIFEDAEGNRFSYLGNRLGMEDGDTRTIKATVKAHEEREGVKQTRLKRPVIIDEPSLAPRFVAGATPIKLA